MRENKYPKLAVNSYPEYYGDVINLFTMVDMATIQWTTKYFYDLQIKKENVIPKAEEKWLRLRNINYDWGEVWKGACTSYAPEKQQETHYRLLHLSLPTLEQIRKWAKMENLNPNCKACRQNNKNKLETHLHLFFDCPQAYNLWRQVKKIIQKLIPKEKVQCFMFLMNIFPKGMNTTMKRQSP